MDVDETQEERLVVIPRMLHEHLQGEDVVDGRSIGSEARLDV